MSYTNIDFVYLNEEDMIRAGVLDAAKCIETMRDTMAFHWMMDLIEDLWRCPHIWVVDSILPVRSTMDLIVIIQRKVFPDLY